MEQFEGVDKITLSTLEQQLENAGIDVSKWGTGEAKTVGHLLREIENGEATLTTDPEGNLLRKVEVCIGDVLYVSPEGKIYRLKEEKQVFTDGRERERNLREAIGEKMKMGESSEECMIRGIKEELDIEGDVSLKNMEVEEQPHKVQSYPGLQTQRTRHKFEIMLNDKQFKKEGYMEKQEDKTTYFIWEEIK